MGKKRVAESTGADTLKESDKQQAALSAQKTKGKKKSRVLELALIHIRSSYNNVKITVTDSEGNVVGWATSGAAGFKGPRKATPYAASRVTELLMSKLERVDMREVKILVNGIGAGRDAAIRALMGKGLNITSINDVTPLPHNGCRPKKPRRT